MTQTAAEPKWIRNLSTKLSDYSSVKILADMKWKEKMGKKHQNGTSYDGENFKYRIRHRASGLFELIGWIEPELPKKEEKPKEVKVEKTQGKKSS